VNTFNAIVKPHRGGSEELVETLLRLLFPKMEQLTGPTTALSYEGKPQWRAERRICDPVVFDHFFTAALPHGEVSDRELSELLKSSVTSEAMDAYVKRITSEDRARQFVEALNSYVMSQRVSADVAKGVVCSLVRHGDWLQEPDPEARDAAYRLSLLDQVVDTVRTLVVTYFGSDPDYVEGAFVQTVREDPFCFVTPCVIATQFLKDVAIDDILAAKAAALLASGQILDHPRPGFVANWCRSHNGPDVAKAIVVKVAGSPTALVRLLRDSASPRRAKSGEADYAFDAAKLAADVDLTVVVDGLLGLVAREGWSAFEEEDAPLVKAALRDMHDYLRKNPSDAATT
jgi:hypothetical protein